MDDITGYCQKFFHAAKQKHKSFFFFFFEAELMSSVLSCGNRIKQVHCNNECFSHPVFTVKLFLCESIQSSISDAVDMGERKR